MYRIVSIIVLVLTMVCCQQRVDHGGRTPLVEVGGRYLYAEDLDKLRPIGISRDDSVLFAEGFIRNWVEDELLWQKAEKNIAERQEVAELVAAYRRSLVLHLYQQALMEERIGNVINQREVDSLYREHPEQFRLEYPLSKGLFIKIPLKGKDVNSVRRWYTQTDKEILDKLEKYSLQYAADYLYFYDQWVKLEDVIKKLPVKVDNIVKYVKQNPDIELKDTAFYYFLHVDSLLDVGTPKPIEYAAGEIQEALLNMHRIDFVESLRNQLYEEAQKDGDVIYYY